MTKTVRVGDISEQVRGVTYSKADAVSTPQPGFVPVLRAGNITDNALSLHDLVYVPASRVSAKQRVRKNDVVIAASSGSLDVVGKAARSLTDLDGGFGAFLKVLRPDTAVVDPAYFGHYFNTSSYRRTVSSLAAGANINNLKNEHLNDLHIPLPPLSEQRRIAAILDHTDALRAKRRQAITHLDQLAQAIFHDMFGDQPASSFKPMVDICDRITVGVVVKPASHYVEVGIPALRTLNVKPGFIDMSDLVYFSEESNNGILAKSKLRTGDLVVSRTGRAGVAAVVPAGLNGTNAIDLIIVTPAAELVESLYLEALLNSQFGARLVMDQQRGQIQQHFNVGSLKEAHIPVPGLDRQKDFSERIRQIDATANRAAKQLAELDAAIMAIQSRAFSGVL